MFKKIMIGVAVSVVVLIAIVGVKTASADSLSISTNSGVYAVGQPVQFCYTVPAPGFVRIDDFTPDGHVKTLVNGIDDGYGGCLWATATPPTGYECLRITFQFFDGAIMANQTCFNVFWAY